MPKGADNRHPNSEALIGDEIADILLAHGLCAVVDIAEEPPKHKAGDKPMPIPCFINIFAKSGRFNVTTNKPCMDTEKDIRSRILHILPDALAEVDKKNPSNIDIILYVDNEKIPTSQRPATYVNRRLEAITGLMFALGSTSYDERTKLMRTRLCLLSIPSVLKITDSFSRQFPFMVENYTKNLSMTIQSLDKDFTAITEKEIKDLMYSKKPYHEYNPVVLHALLAVLLEHISYVRLVAVGLSE